MSNRRCKEPIYPKMVVMFGIRVLAGGSYDDIMNSFEISKAGFYWRRKTNLQMQYSLVTPWTSVFLILLPNGKRPKKDSPKKVWIKFGRDVLEH
jgi:hypothetical protein